MTTIHSPSPEHYPDAEPPVGIPMAEHSAFVPLNEQGTLPYIEGPGHRSAVADLAAAATRNSLLEMQKRTDKMTGIANREALEERMKQVFEKADAGERKQPVLLFIDLDNFKRANDTEGHAVGDELLKKVANKMDGEITVRKDQDEMIARLSGDEFVALIFPENKDNSRRDKDLSEEEVLQGFMERLMKGVSDVASEAGTPYVEASIGVAYRQPGETAHALLERADKEMYRAKQAKKRKQVGDNALRTKVI